MSIEYIQDDLFNTDCGIIVHGCNAKGIMGSGVAKGIRENYPKSFQEYRTYCNENGPEKSLGKVIFKFEKGKYICNAITQMHYGRENKRYVNYEAVARCMETINHVFGKNEKIAMPMIGAGLANGDWNVIEAIIQSELDNHFPKVYFIESVQRTFTKALGKTLKMENG